MKYNSNQNHQGNKFFTINKTNLNIFGKLYGRSSFNLKIKFKANIILTKISKIIIQQEYSSKYYLDNYTLNILTRTIKY